MLTNRAQASLRNAIKLSPRVYAIPVCPFCIGSFDKPCPGHRNSPSAPSSKRSVKK